MLERWRLMSFSKFMWDAVWQNEESNTQQNQSNTLSVNDHMFTSGRGSWRITFCLEELAECCAGGGGGVQAPFLCDWPTASWQVRPDQIQQKGEIKNKNPKNKSRRKTRSKMWVKENQLGSRIKDSKNKKYGPELNYEYCILIVHCNYV